MQTPYYSTVLFALLTNGPLLVFFVLAMMSHVPADWGRAAMAAYASLIIVFAAGLSAASGAHAAFVAAEVVGAMLVLGVGGPYGLLIAAAGLGAFAVAHYAGLPVPVHWSLGAVAAGFVAVAAVKWLAGKW